MTTSNKSLATRAAASLGKLAGSISALLRATSAAFSGQGEPHHEDVRFESSDISGRNVFLVGMGILLSLWLLTALLYFYFSPLARERARSSPPSLPVVGRAEALPPEPRLQQSPPRDLKALRLREDWELNHYRWIDKSRGIVAIPVEQAIQIVAEQGIAPKNLAPNPTSTPPEEGTRLTGFEGKVEPEPR